MPSTPPRRSRRPPRDGGGIPLIPLLLGVIVLGFVIGAGLSIAGRRNTVAYVTPSPALPQPVTPAPTERPTPLPTDGPTEAPTQTPSTEPSAEATDTPTPLTTSEATARASAEPSVAASSIASAAAATPTPLRKAAQAHAHVAKAAVPVTPTVAPETEPAGTPEATHVPHVAPVTKPAIAATSAAAAGTNGESSDFPRLAAAVVRQYLVAVSRGDEDSAYAALGASPGDRGVSLTEAGIVDARTKIGNVESHGSSSAATVSVDLQTPQGLYVGQYTVRRNETGAAVIVAHSLNK